MGPAQKRPSDVRRGRKISLIIATRPGEFLPPLLYLFSELKNFKWPANPWQPPDEVTIVETFYKAHLISQVCISYFIDRYVLS